MTNKENAIAKLEELRSQIRVYAANAIEDPNYHDALEERVDQAEYVMGILIDLIKEAK